MVSSPVLRMIGKQNAIAASVLFALCVLPFLVSERADIVPLRNAFRELKHATVALSDAVIAAHGDVTEHSDLLVGAARLLPRLYKRTVVKIDRERVVRRLEYLHFKD